MTDNPLEPDPEREQRIRERAYRLWEEDGRPEGQDAEFWERAEALIAMEDHPDAALEPNPLTEDEPIPGVTVDEAALQDNLGEFPDRLTDQGDRRETPITRSEQREEREPVAQSARGRR